MVDLCLQLWKKILNLKAYSDQSAVIVRSNARGGSTFQLENTHSR